jgi:hypothetical protein
MSSLRISLRHADLLQTPCSIVFMKHIEGTMSAPESALNAATHGQLQALYTQHEREDHEILDSDTPQGRVRAYVVNFHKQDLPFSYRSVDRYARTILRVAGTEQPEAASTPVTVVTAIHGPGAGLDASESMETLNRNTQDWYSHICGSEIQDTVEPAIVGRPAVRPYER